MGNIKTRLATVLTTLLMLVASMIGPITVGWATVPGADRVTLDWDVNNSVYYGDRNTPIFTTTQASGETSFAYCVDPTTLAPDPGAYGTMAIEQLCPGRADQIRAGMWFCYGGPGFDASMWPATWSDGSSWSNDNYYAASHLILSQLVRQEAGHTYYGAGTSFINYAANSFMGIDRQNNTVNRNATYFQIIDRAGEVPADFNCYFLNVGQWDVQQFICCQDYYELPAKTGSLEIVKTSSIPALSSNNPCYSLQGATFGVYADEACRELAASVTIGSDGRGSAGELPEGTYWVKELTAPTGFALNTSIEHVEVPAGKTVTVTMTDMPQVAQQPLLLTKLDAETGTVSQGAGSLAGAKFNICYYAGIYTAQDLPQRETRSWTFATDAEGRIMYDDAWLITGDPLYRDGQGAAVLPLGTITIQETKAPNGYLISDNSKHLITIEAGASTQQTVTFTAVTITDKVGRGGLLIQKVDTETLLPVPQGGASLSGAEFAVANLNDNPVVVEGVSYAPGATVMTLTTDTYGFVTTEIDTLPQGIYRVWETKAPDGYRPIDEEWIVEIFNESIVPVGWRPSGTDKSLKSKDAVRNDTAITSDHASSWLYGLFTPRTAFAANDGVVAEQVIRGGLRVYKIDADTASAAAQGDATLEGTEFSIVSLNDNPVIVDGVSYASGETVKKIYTDATGMAETGAYDLPYGTYSVQETKAPLGYRSAGQIVCIEKNGVIVELGRPFEDDVKRGGVAVYKVDADTGEHAPQGSAALAGARFEIVNVSDTSVIVDEEEFLPGEVVMNITTDETGFATTDAHALPYGRYTITEVEPPAGYLINDTVWEFSIETDGAIVQVGETYQAPHQDKTPGFFGRIASWFAPREAQADEAPREEDVDDTAVIPEQVIRGGVTVQKIDAETQGAAQGVATLAGTQFAIASCNDNPVVVDGAVYGNNEIVMVITTDENGWAATGDLDLPFGTYTIAEIREPDGYLPADPSSCQEFSITSDGEIVELDRAFENIPIRGGISVQKLDDPTGLNEPLAAGTLCGTVFAISNANEQDVLVDGVYYAPGEVICTLTTDVYGHAETGAYDLPYGGYSVVEICPPEGYVHGSGQAQIVHIAEDGIVVACDAPFTNRIRRGDIAGIKIEDETGNIMPGVAFLITSLTTGEQHVLVADDEGRFSTASSAAAHTVNTNANDAALGPDGTVIDASLLSPDNGIWFSGSLDTLIEPDDDQGALPFDKYRIEELLTDASYGHTLVTFDVPVRHDGHIVDLGTVDNHMIKLHTQAILESTGVAEGAAISDAQIIDTVSYEGLIPGTTYELRCELIDRATGEKLFDRTTEDGDDASSESDASSENDASSSEEGFFFTPDASSGSVDICYPVDASELAGRRIVVYEYLYLDGQEIASHADPADNDQTVGFVAIGTTASGEVSATHEEQVREQTVLVDTVAYTGLTPQVPYTLESVLMDRTTGAPFEDDHGKPVVSVTEFTPEAASGTIDTAFTFTGAKHVGTTTVAFETLRRDEVIIVEHTDIDDAQQAVTLIDIGTEALDRASQTHTGTPSEDAAIIDTVSYQGLIPGETYTLTGSLVDRQTGCVVETPSGAPATISVDLVPEYAEGTIKILFEVDASEWAGRTTVVVEYLEHDGAIIASHEDLDDAGQTVTWSIPSIPQTAQPDSLTKLAVLMTMGALIGIIGAGMLVADRTSHTDRLS